MGSQNTPQHDNKVLFAVLSILALFSLGFLVLALTSIFDTKRLLGPELERQLALRQQLEDAAISPFFIENSGQGPEEIGYYHIGKHQSVFFRGDGVLFQSFIDENADTLGEVVFAARDPQVKVKTYFLRFIGAPNDGFFSGQNERQSRLNYFIGEDQNKWLRDVRTYQHLVYQGMYPKVDLLYTFDHGVMKYSYLLHKGADSASILFQLEGVDTFEIDVHGNLLISVGDQTYTHKAPFAFQDIDGERRSVRADYRVVDAAQRVIGFTLGEYDPNHTLILDPPLTDINNSSYIGGSSVDYLYDIEISNNRVYTVGAARSTNFPTLGDVYDSSGDGSDTKYDIVVSQFNSTLTSLVASTYLGGANNEYGHGIDFDSSGNVYLVGYTDSTDFPTTAGVVDQVGDASTAQTDMLVSKLTSSLGDLSASTYLSGSGGDYGYDIDLDASNNIFLLGSSTSTDFVTTSGAYDTTHNGDHDVVVLKLTSNLQTASAATYVGGTGEDVGYGLALDTSGRPFITGYTQSATFPTGGTPYDSVIAGVQDAFVARFDSNLSSLAGGSTFLGGARNDVAYDIALNASNEPYVVGETYSTDFPTDGTSYDQTGDGSTSSRDGFVAKLSSGLSTLDDSTYLGATRDDVIQGVLVANDGTIFVTGHTFNTNFPVSSGAYDEMGDGSTGTEDAFVSQFAADLGSLNASTYLGGTSRDYGRKLAQGTDRAIYVAGYTQSSNFPTVAGSYDTSHNGVEDGFITRFIGPNTAPTLTNFSFATPTDGSGGITVGATIDDADDDSLTLSTYFKAGSTCSFSGVSSSTLSSTLVALIGSPAVVNTSQITLDTDAGAVNASWTWLSATDAASQEGTYCYFVSPADGFESGTTVSGTVTIDNVAPTSASMSVTGTAATSVQLAFGTSATDTRFSHYEIAYVVGDGPISLATPTFNTWTQTDDANLAAQDFNSAVRSVITGLQSGTKYTFNIIAYDTYGNTSLGSSDVSTTTDPTSPINVSATRILDRSATISWGSDSNGSAVEYYVSDAKTGRITSGWVSGTSVSMTGLTCDTDYAFVVKARNAVGVESDSSARVSFRTVSCVARTSPISSGSNGGSDASRPSSDINTPTGPTAEPVVSGDVAKQLEQLGKKTADFSPSSGFIATKNGQQILYTNDPTVLFTVDTSLGELATFFASDDSPSTESADGSFVQTSSTLIWNFDGRDGTKCLNARFRNQETLVETKTFVCVILDTERPARPSLAVPQKVTVPERVGEGSTSVVRGQAEPFSTVRIQWQSREDRQSLAPARFASALPLFRLAQADEPEDEVQADENGDWESDVPEDLPPGDYDIVVTAEDQAGNESDPETVSVVVEQSSSGESEQGSDGGQSEEAQAPESNEGEEEQSEESAADGGPAEGGETEVAAGEDTPAQTGGPVAAPSEESVDLEDATTTEDGSVQLSTSSLEDVASLEEVVALSQIATPELVEAVQVFLDNEEVEVLNEAVIAPAVVAAGAANVAVGFGLPQIFVLLRYLFGQPLVLLGMRKRKSWGVVYHAFSKKPIDLAVVRLIDVKRNAVVQSRVTDRNGRYFFLVGPGKYRIEVTKAGFLAKSHYLEKRKEDSAFADLYHGQAFSVKTAGTAVKYNIPLDPLEQKVTTTQILREHSVAGIQQFLSVIGIVVTAISFVISPTPLMATFLALHLFFYAAFYMFSRRALPGSFGVVTDTRTKKPVKDVVIRVFDSTYDKLIDTTVTDRRGRYGILVGPSSYYVTYEKDGYSAKKSGLIDYTSSETAGAGGVIARNERITKKRSKTKKNNRQ